MRRIKAFLATTLFCLSGCSDVEPSQYAANTPVFDIRDYLNGNLEAWGVLINRDGTAEPQFFVKMKGHWKGNEGTLEEEFTYTSGEKKHRLWHFTVQDDHHFTGTAGDVLGIGQGQQYGNAVNMKYVLQVPHDGKTIDINMDDWLYRIDEAHVINRTEMRKFGFKVGELVIGFKKLPTQQSTAKVK